MAKSSSNSKAGGFLGGFVILILGVVLLWYNEGRTVKTQSAINEAESQYTDVASDNIDSKYEGKVIATKGTLDLTSVGELKDQKFGITVSDSAKLERVVEIYQWEESCETDDNNNEHCTYTKDWSDRLIDSSDFKESGHSNPTSVAVESEELIGSNIKVGAFSIPEKLVKRLSYDKDLKNDQLTAQYKNTVEGFVVENNYITNTVAEKGVQVGDLRISYKVAGGGEVSLLGVQSGNTLTAFVGKKGKSIYEIRRGTMSGKEILNDLTKSNNTLKWILRLVGVLLTMLGISSIFSPLTNLANKVPVLGSIVGMGTGLISFVLGLAISLVVIAVAWFRFRPILSIALIAIVVGLLVFLKVRKSKVKSVEAPKAETNNE